MFEFLHLLLLGAWWSGLQYCHQDWGRQAVCHQGGPDWDTEQGPCPGLHPQGGHWSPEWAMYPLRLSFLSFCADIFLPDFIIFFTYECQVRMSALKSCQKIFLHGNSNSTAPHMLHILPMWLMKDFGHVILVFVLMHFLGELFFFKR